MKVLHFSIGFFLMIFKQYTVSVTFFVDLNKACEVEHEIGSVNFTFNLINGILGNRKFCKSQVRIMTQTIPLFGTKEYHMRLPPLYHP